MIFLKNKNKHSLLPFHISSIISGELDNISVGFVYKKII